MIKSLRIQNFKCWKDTGEFRLAPITGFFGTNSSGKSSILQFLLMLKQTVESSNRSQVLNLGDEKSYTQLGTFGDIVFCGAEIHEETLRWDLSWRPIFHTIPWPGIRVLFTRDEDVLFELDKMSFEAAVGQILVNGLPYTAVEHFRYYFTKMGSETQSEVGVKRVTEFGYEVTSIDFPLTPNQHVADNPLPLKCYGFQPQARDRFVNGWALPVFEALFQEVFTSTEYLGPLRAEPKSAYVWAGTNASGVGKGGEYAVEALLASRKDGITVEARVATWLRDLGLVDSLSIDELVPGSGHFRVLVKTTAESAPVPITKVGFGISQVLPVLVLCSLAMNKENEISILILEQPELHLHPKAQMELADVLVEVANSGKVQIILESHSEHLLMRLQRRIAEKAIEKDDVALYFCTKPGDEAHLKELELNNFGYITNWPQDFFGDQLRERTEMMEAALERERQGEAA